MLNTHPINRLSKAGAALVNTISSLEYSLVIILYEIFISFFSLLIHEWGVKYGNVICKLSKIDFLSNYIQ